MKQKKVASLGATESRVVAVDLFCGAGGLSHGLQKAGVPVVAGFDLDADCKFAVETNNGAPFIHADVATLQASEIEPLFPTKALRVLAGCAPCQPFSRYARAGSGDNEKWGLLSHFLRLALELRPAVLTMENVPELDRAGVFAHFVDVLRQRGYSVTCSRVFCPDYGIPQQRTRLVLFASLYGDITIEPPTRDPEQYSTVSTAISGLRALEAGGMDPLDPLHRCCRLTQVNMERISRSRPGGCWRDWPIHLRAQCHRNKSGETYPSVYGRMAWDTPSPTITTQFFGYGNGRFGHPNQNRAISLREGAILQSFPLTYLFTAPADKPSFAKLGRMIGNAVPVRLGEIVGNSIVKHLEGVTA